MAAIGSQLLAADRIGNGDDDAVSLGQLLDEAGHIVLPQGFSGSIDPAGFQMVSARGQAPRFVRASGHTGQWSDGEFGAPACAGTVRALAVVSGELFVGGSFQACGFTAASNIARFDPATGEFTPLGDGVNNSVSVLATVGDDLYVGGFLTEAGGAPASRIAVFDTTQTGNAGWSALGDGVSEFSSSVSDLAAVGTDLYVGGDFTQAGGKPANYIAVFDTTETGNAGWSALGDGVSSDVRTLAVIGDDLYAGGLFTQAGGKAASYIAVFDTTKTGNSAWSALGDGANSTVAAMAAVGDDLYVGGNFTEAGGGPASRIAMLDTTKTGNSAWSALGDGVDNLVNTLAVLNDDLYVGGGFTQAGGDSADRIAVFDTTQSGNPGWGALGDGMNSTVESLAALGSDLYVGGAFTRAGGAPANRMAVFDTTQSGNAGWSALGEGVNGFVNALAAIGDHLYVGGSFSQVGGIAANRIAVFDTTQTGGAGWAALGDGADNTVSALATIGDNLYVGGSFTQAGGAPARRIAVFDTTQTGNAGWSALGDGVNGSVNALAAIGDNLYVGGTFNQAGGAPASRIAVFDTTQTGNAGWAALGAGLNSSVRALAAIGDDLYVGGGFIQAGGASASRIAVFDTTQSGNAGWAALGDGMNSTVESLAALGSDLYVGGSFTEAGITPANRIAVFDTTESGNAGWSALGDGVSGFVFAIATLRDHLYVAGNFGEAGGAPASRIAVFDTTQSGNAGWAAPGGDVNSVINALALVGDELYVGGLFTVAGGNVNAYIARYDTNLNQPPVAQADSIVVAEDTSVNGNVLADNGSGIDTDPDSDPVEVQSPGSLTADGIGGSVTISASGDFSYAPPSDASGTATFPYTIADPFGDTDSATVTIIVNPVNDPPTFAASDPAAVPEDAGAQTLSNWATFDAGAANEAQGVSAYTVGSVSDATLFSAGPTVDASGTLRYTPAPDANGASTFEVTVQDDGGTANGGVDMSGPNTFTITVLAVNDPPSFAPGGDVVEIEDRAYAESWATAISPGPPDEAGQSVSFLVTGNSNPGLFQGAPAIDPAGVLTYTPTPDTTGTAALDVVALDDGPSSGDPVQSAPITFQVDVIAAADLVVDKTSTSFFTPPGGTLRYQVFVTNPGPSDVVQARVVDDPPTRLGDVTWTCTPAGGASCAASGSLAIDEFVDLPEGGSVTFELDATLLDTTADPITNTVEAQVPLGVLELAPANNRDSDTDTIGLFADSFESSEPD